MAAQRSAAPSAPASPAASLSLSSGSAGPRSHAAEPAVTPPRALLPLLCGLLVLTGAAGLIYQVAWVRLLGLALGVTVYAVSTVLAAYMGGLAIGSIVGGRLADRLRAPLRAYGLVEIGVGLTALATPFAFRALQEVYRGLALVADPAQAPLLAGVVRTVLAFALLLIPTALMGATLPLATRGVRRAADVAGDSRAMGALYALNTIGAISGSLAAGFVFIGGVGITATVMIAAACNLVAGVAALLLSILLREGQPRHATVSADPPAAVLQGDARGETTAPGVESPTLARVAFWVFGISGGVSLAYEVAWARVLAVLFDSSIYGFVVMLATVLLGIAVGSAVASFFVSRCPAARVAGLAFGWIEIGIGLGAVFSLGAFGWVWDLLTALRDSGSPLFVRLLRTEPRFMAMLCVTTILPASVLMGATFPFAARLYAAGASRLGQRLGGVYAANVAGAIVGSLLAGFVLIPLVGAHWSLLLLALVNVALGVWLLAVSARGRRMLPGLAGALGVASVVWGGLQPPVHAQVFRQRFGDQQLLWYQEGLENTVSVGRNEEGVTRLYTNSLSQTNDTPDLVRYQRVIGHLAALLSPRSAPRVLVVGLGGGATPGAIAQYSGARMDLVELSGAVVAAAPFFRVPNADLLSRPNVRLAIDDGRNWLLRSRQQYDIITADIVPPSHAGATNLYSEEYFRLVARNLAPDGVMVQWVTPESAFFHQTIVRTFLKVFPNSTLWLGGDLLIGSPSPIRVDPAAMQRRLNDPGARAALAEVGFNTPQDVLAQFRADGDELRAYVGDGPTLTDDRPLLEYFRSLDNPYGPPDLSRFSSDPRKILTR